MEDDDDTLDVLQSLAALSRQLVQVRFATWCGLSWIHCDRLGLVAEPGGTQPAAGSWCRCAVQPVFAVPGSWGSGSTARMLCQGLQWICSVHRSNGAGSGAGNVQA